MKPILASLTASILAALGLVSAYQPQTDEAQLRSHVAAELVYASFTPITEPTPVPAPKDEPVAIVPTVEPAEEKPAPVPVPAPKPLAMPAAPSGRWMLQSYGWRGRQSHWVWVRTQPQTYRSQSGSCGPGGCRGRRW